MLSWASLIPAMPHERRTKQRNAGLNPPGEPRRSVGFSHGDLDITEHPPPTTTGGGCCFVGVSSDGQQPRSRTCPAAGRPPPPQEANYRPLRAPEDPRYQASGGRHPTTSPEAIRSPFDAPGSGALRYAGDRANLRRVCPTPATCFRPRPTTDLLLKRMSSKGLQGKGRASIGHTRRRTPGSDGV